MCFKKLKKGIFMSLVNKTPLKEQVYTIIKDRIMSQQYQMGERININSLALELGISNTPIRDALALLEKERLITITPYAGPQVVRLNSTVFHETFDAVLVLLLGGYEFCIYHNRIPLLASLMSESIDVQKAVADTGSHRAFAEATIAVDTAIVTACNNPHLTSIFSGTFSLQTLLLIHDYRTSDYDRWGNIREHEIILGNITAGRYEEARKLLQQHYVRSILFSY